jgi:DNA-binding NtrC family response regulator
MRRLPWNFDQMMKLFWRPGNTAQLMLCVEGTRTTFAEAAQIDIPSLTSRRSEWPRILNECIAEACHALHAPQNYLDDDEREWILRCSTLDADPTVADIEKAALRVIAIKLTGRPAAAAKILGMAPVSLERWLQRRWPTTLAHSGDRRRWTGMLARSGYKP